MEEGGVQVKADENSSINQEMDPCPCLLLFILAVLWLSFYLVVSWYSSGVGTHSAAEMLNVKWDCVGNREEPRRRRYVPRMLPAYIRLNTS